MKYALLNRQGIMFRGVCGATLDYFYSYYFLLIIGLWCSFSIQHPPLYYEKGMTKKMVNYENINDISDENAVRTTSSDQNI